MRKTIEVRGARENNLQNVTVEVPRDQLVVVTGVSGSGKSSLAFDTLYAEGQRRLMSSMSTYARRFVSQMKKPDVDFVNGLSPVVSIDQKTVGNNPRSTVGTMTDIWDYLRMLFATIGEPRCPLCREPVTTWTAAQMLERMLGLPDGTEVEIRAPLFHVYGEDYEYLIEQVRTNGYRHARVDGRLMDLGADVDLDDGEPHQIEAIIDNFVVQKGIDKQVMATLLHGATLGDGFLSFHIVSRVPRARRAKFEKGFGCQPHGYVAMDLSHADFTFNDVTGACVTCGGLGTSKRVHTTLLVPDPSRPLNRGAIIKEAFNHDKNTWGGRILHSLAVKYKFRLDVPWQDLPQKVTDLVFYGAEEKFPIVLPEGTRQGKHHAGKEVRFPGVVNWIEQRYRWYRKQGQSNSGMEDYLQKVMVEHPCPDCEGARLKLSRRLVTISDLNIHETGEQDLATLLAFIKKIKPPAVHREVTRLITREITTRLELLIDIGLDYLNLNRRSGTLSGGESQRIRLSSQIGSGLMGMLYVLDEPSIGLHPKDNEKMIRTLRRLRDIGNSVVVVEHDEDTIRAADHVIEIGPGPGVHGGRVVVTGPVEKIENHRKSTTGAFLSGRRRIEVPAERRRGNGTAICVKGARHNNLQSVDVEIPLGMLVAVTGASGSGKSSLVHEVICKQLSCRLYDSRIMAGDHDELTGEDLIDDVINIDQSPIGRNSRSNPATYIGFYDNIRKLFAGTEQSQQRGYTASRFSFNVKGGRCEECSGDGTITTSLSFMPDVEVTCPACKGARYNEETLEVLYNGRNIAEVLDLSVEDAVVFFENEKTIHRKVQVLYELGLGYITVGHASTLLSGGEAQRVKLAAELGKLKRGKHNLYVLDEPTTGLHFADIQRLLECLNRLIENGHSVLVIEHNLDVIKTADYVIDLGPEGGHKGGRILATGTPEKVAKTRKSHTGRFLKTALENA